MSNWATALAQPEAFTPGEKGSAVLFHAAGDAMLLISSVFVDVNPRALTLFRATPNQLLGRLPEDFFPALQADGRDSGIAAIGYYARADTGETLTYEWQFCRPDHSVFSATVTLSAVLIGGKNLRLAIIRENSAISPTEKLLAERTEQLKSVSGELDSLLFSVSHDFRAAIRGIATCTRIVLEDYAGQLDEEGKRWLSHIHGDSVHLDRFIGALLDLSRVSHAGLNPAWIDLSSLALETSHLLAATHPQRFVEFKAEAGLKVWGEVVLLRTLMENLLENAWKFTGKTSNAQVEFGSIVTGPEERVFFIRDNGTGFDMAHSARLFVAFQRLHRDPEFDGCGIGLAKVRRIVHRHGGKVWASAQPGIGATFYFTLGRRPVE